MRFWGCRINFRGSPEAQVDDAGIEAPSRIDGVGNHAGRTAAFITGFSRLRTDIITTTGFSRYRAGNIIVTGLDGQDVRVPGHAGDPLPVVALCADDAGYLCAMSTTFLHEAQEVSPGLVTFGTIETVRKPEVPISVRVMVARGTIELIVPASIGFMVHGFTREPMTAVSGHSGTPCGLDQPRSQ